MYSTPTLATRFARNTRVMRGDQPLSEDQMRAAWLEIGAVSLRLRHLARMRDTARRRQLAQARTKRGQSADTDRLAG